MAVGDDHQQKLIEAVAFAKSGGWDEAHHIVQNLGDEPAACWVHGVLHKIVGDEVNARYWYARCGHVYDDFLDVASEWAAIEKMLSDTSANEI